MATKINYLNQTLVIIEVFVW